MRFLIAVVDDGTNTGTADEMAAIDAFNEKLRINGHWVLAWGLEDPRNAKVIDSRGGDAVITDGPLVNAPEFMSGLWIIDVESEEQALALAAEGSRACNRKVEIRAFHQ